MEIKNILLTIKNGKKISDFWINFPYLHNRLTLMAVKYYGNLIKAKEKIITDFLLNEKHAIKEICEEGHTYFIIYKKRYTK